MELNKSIKKTLIETKEKKENFLIEQKLIKSRFLMVFENVDNIKNFKNLPNSKKDEIRIGIVLESLALKNEGLINEDNFDFGSTLKNIFGSSFLGVGVQTIFEPIIHKILGTVGVPEGFFRNFVVSYLTSRPSELWASLSDCRKLTKLLAESLVEASVMTLQDKVGFTGKISMFLRNTIGSALKDTGVVRNLETKLADTVCGIVGNFDKNGKKLVRNLRGKGKDVLGSLKTKAADFFNQ